MIVAEFSRLEWSFDLWAHQSGLPSHVPLAVETSKFQLLTWGEKLRVDIVELDSSHR
jgi:hypothetical protein